MSQTLLRFPIRLCIFFSHPSSCQCKKKSSIEYIFILLIVKINLRTVCFLVCFTLITNVNERSSIDMATKKSEEKNSKKETVDCIYERLRSQVTRIGSAAGITSHIFFVFGASVSEDLIEKISYWVDDLGRFSEEENLSDTLVALSGWIFTGTYSIYWLRTKSIDHGENLRKCR